MFNSKSNRITTGTVGPIRRFYKSFSLIISASASLLEGAKLGLLRRLYVVRSKGVSFALWMRPVA